MTSLAAPAHDPHDEDRERGLVGVWIFLASELLFFGGLLLAYAAARSHWPAGFAAAGAHTHAGLGTLNTALLLTSSALVAGAVGSGDDDAGPPAAAPALLGLAAALGLAFLAVKGVEYAMEWREGLFPGPGFALAGQRGAALFFMLYWFTTALHALHLLVGIAVLVAFAAGLRRGAAWATRSRVEVAGLYWHFVDIVWIVLYPLLYLLGRNA